MPPLCPGFGPQSISPGRGNNFRFRAEAHVPAVAARMAASRLQLGHRALHHTYPEADIAPAVA